ncbi:MAG: phage DNA encapsidation protein, partial [Muribaculaceae bacterium]|nr:phage DNA encapsidation protein [Muribaculaceae bacterium]
PELYLCVTNRTGGKTTWFSEYMLNKFLKTGSKFALIYRFNYELDGVADKFFKDIGGLWHPNSTMFSKKKARGIFHELYIDDQHCGYAMALNNCDALKRYSHFFSDVDRMFMDEFQSETDHYCEHEIEKFISLHTTVARGQGMPNRYVPVYMCGNPVSILNPYYTALGISERLRNETKFLRGIGYVLEQGVIDGAAKASRESAFNRAFGDNKYIAYSSQCVYLNDSKTFIESLSGPSKYLCTLRYDGIDYGLRQYSHQGFLYCDNKPDKSALSKFVVTTDDHRPNYVMLQTNSLFLSQLRYYFANGAFRFKNAKCKEAIIKALSY